MPLAQKIRTLLKGQEERVETLNPESDSAALDPILLREELKRLKSENEALRTLASQALQQGPSSRSGYLYRHVDWSSGIFAGRWEMQYFVLVNKKMMQFQAEKDVGMAPRGYYDLDRCTVEVEGPKKNHFHVFSVLTDTRETLLRLSTESKSDLNRWLDALEAAGCAIASLASESQPSRAPSVAASAAQGNGDVGDTATSGPIAPGLRRRKGEHEGPEEAGPSAQNGHKGEGKGKVRFRRGFTGSTPMHRELKYSLLSSEQLSYQRHAGLVNLGTVIIVATNFRLILENILKYGIRFKPWEWVGVNAHDPQPTLMMLGWPFLGLSIALALVIEKYLAGRLARETGPPSWASTERLGFALNLLNTSAALLAPCYAIYQAGHRASPLPAFILVFVTVIVWMKLVSYAHCNADCRDARRKGELIPGERGSDEEIQGLQHRTRYPEQLTWRNMAYFMAAPTLCYQVSFPSSSRIRVRWLMRRVLELAVYLGLMIFLVTQYVEPAVANSIRPLETFDWLRVIERVLKVALPMLYVWICGFYVFFHLYLNIVAEVLRFGDRLFYLDWWNATTFEAYWRMWNLPVHRWMLRTVYYPCVRKKIPRPAAMFLVFFISAVFHELIVGLPLHMFRAWAFFGIILQVPMIVFTNWLKSRIKNEQLGNVIFWITFSFIGQPCSVLMYYSDFVHAQQVRALAATGHPGALAALGRPPRNVTVVPSPLGPPAGASFFPEALGQGGIAAGNVGGVASALGAGDAVEVVKNFAAEVVGNALAVVAANATAGLQEFVRGNGGAAGDQAAAGAAGDPLPPLG